MLKSFWCLYVWYIAYYHPRRPFKVYRRRGVWCHKPVIPALGGGGTREGDYNHPVLHNEFENSLGCRRSCLRKNVQRRGYVQITYKYYDIRDLSILRFGSWNQASHTLSHANQGMTALNTDNVEANCEDDPKSSVPGRREGCKEAVCGANHYKVCSLGSVTREFKYVCYKIYQ